VGRKQDEDGVQRVRSGSQQPRHTQKGNRNEAYATTLYSSHAHGQEALGRTCRKAISRENSRMNACALSATVPGRPSPNRSCQNQQRKGKCRAHSPGAPCSCGLPPFSQWASQATTASPQDYQVPPTASLWNECLQEGSRRAKGSVRGLRLQGPQLTVALRAKRYCR